MESTNAVHMLSNRGHIVVGQCDRLKDYCGVLIVCALAHKEILYSSLLCMVVCVLESMGESFVARISA